MTTEIDENEYLALQKIVKFANDINDSLCIYPHQIHGGDQLHRNLADALLDYEECKTNQEGS